MDRNVTVIARGQDGLVRLDQSIAGGVTRRAVQRRIESGRWEAVQAGVYRMSSGRSTTP